jgi:hypothetical protein
MLAMYPNVMNKLRGEVLERVGTSRLPTYDDVRSMKYLRAVLNGKFNFHDLPQKKVLIEGTDRDFEAVPTCVSYDFWFLLLYSSMNSPFFKISPFDGR